MRRKNNMAYVLLVILFSQSGASSQNVIQIQQKDYETCQQSGGELRALLQKAGVKNLTTCIKTQNP